MRIQIRILTPYRSLGFNSSQQRYRAECVWNAQSTWLDTPVVKHLQLPVSLHCACSLQTLIYSIPFRYVTQSARLIARFEEFVHAPVLKLCRIIHFEYLSSSHAQTCVSWTHFQIVLELHSPLPTVTGLLKDACS